MDSIKMPIVIVMMVALLQPFTSAERWSRQISPNVAGNDWVPLPQACATCKIQVQAADRESRVINYAGPPHHSPTAYTPLAFTQQQPRQFTLVSEPYQFVTPAKFNFQQQQQQQVPAQLQPQALPFVQYQPQQHFVNGYPAYQPPVQQRQQQQQHQAQPLVQHQPLQQQQQPQVVQHHALPLVQQQSPQSHQHHLQSQQSIQLSRPLSYQTVSLTSQAEKPNYQQKIVTQLKALPPQKEINHLKQQADLNAQQQDEVQLLYVPQNLLLQQQKNQGFKNFGAIPTTNPYDVNNFYTSKPQYTPNTSKIIATTTTTAKPFYEKKSKPKPNQPPLAMFMKKSRSGVDESINEVLTTLKGSKDISVVDTVTKKAPKIFIGPSGMAAPEGYMKFGLPYLSSVDPHTNQKRKVDDLPFFVAPLSFRPPPGFTKISLPSPHVGSVIVNSPQSDLLSNPFLGFGEREQTHQYVDPVTGRPQYFSESTASPSTANPSSAFNGQSFSAEPQEYFPSSTREPSSYFPSSTQAPKQFYSQNNMAAGNRGTHHYTTSTESPSDNGKYFPSSTAASPKDHQYYQSSTGAPKDTQYFPSSTGAPKDVQYYPSSTSDPNGQSYFPSSTATPNQHAYFTSSTPSYDHVYRNSPRTEYHSSTDNPSTKFNPASPEPQYFPSSTEASSSAGGRFNSARAQLVSSFNVDRPNTGNDQNLLPNGQVVNEEYFNVEPKKLQNPSEYQPQEELPHKTQPTLYQSLGEPQRQLEQSTQKAQEVFKMKSYYKDQEAIKNRPLINIPRTTPSYETFSYTPVAFNYEIPETTPSPAPITTPKVHPVTFSVEDELREYKLKENRESHVTFYTPSSVDESNEDHSTPRNHKPEYEEPKIVTSNDLKKLRYPHTKSSPQPHEEDERQTTDHINYNLPSKLPPLSAKLPGLVNSLMEENEEEQQEFTTPSSTTTKATRRPITRGRRPVTSTTTNSPSTRRASNRRPTGSYNKPAPDSTDPSGQPRTPSVRNPNRVRYNPTGEERKYFRQRTRNNSGLKRGSTREEENLDYQRDVLNQNYPVIKSESGSPITTTTSKTITTSSTEEITTTENKLVDQPNIKEFVEQEVPVEPKVQQTFFSGMQENLQIAQPYNVVQREDVIYGNQKQHKYNSAEQIYEEEEIPQLPPTTTEKIEEEVVTTRRPFPIRRPFPKLQSSTTTAAPRTVPTTVQPSRERYTIRPRTRTHEAPEKIVKTRGQRIRKPALATTTTAAPTNEDGNLKQISKFNQELYAGEENRPQNKYKSVRKFNRYQPPQDTLDTEESQWSTKLGQNSFQPVSHDFGRDASAGKDIEISAEPEIVTANPVEEFSFNVTPSGQIGSVVSFEEPKKEEESEKKDSSLIDLLEDMLSNEIEANKKDVKEPSADIEEEGRKYANHKEEVTKDEPIDESVKYDVAESKIDLNTKENEDAVDVKKENTPPRKTRRRGVWKRVRPVVAEDAFETAESQNIGTRIFNQVIAEEKSKIQSSFSNKGAVESVGDLVMEVEKDIMETEVTTSVAPDFETTTANNEEADVTTSIPSTTTVVPSTTTTTTTTSTTEQPFELTTEQDEVVKVTTVLPIEDEVPVTPVAPVVNESIISEDEVQPTPEPTTPTTIHSSDNIFSDLGDLFTSFGEDADRDESEYQEPVDSISRVETPFAEESISRVDEELEDKPEEVMPQKKQQYKSISRKRDDSGESTSFHKKLMDSVIFATSTSTEVSHETEICYRGRCIKTDKKL